ncbi:MAG: D-aminoacylase [Firmicutes bacterium]|jgi:N-acyl-D-amino-acid deacylase|nr:D-aminoacylase [Bacillota bacterium]
MYDILFKNCKLVDGTGSPWQMGDLAVKDNKIAAVGYFPNAQSKEAIDLKGLVLSPGFIDIHSHSDFSISGVPYAESRVLQGITTEIGGDCGISAAPVNPDNLDLLKSYVGFLDTGMEFTWQTFDEYLSKMETFPYSVNYGGFVGQGTIRLAVMGFDDRLPTPEEMEKMQAHLAEAMEAGAFGMSTGLIYPPGCYSGLDEIAQLSTAMAPYRGIYESHMRNEGDNVLESVKETIEIGRRANVPVQIVHHKITGRKNWRILGHATLAYVEAARREGLDITLDQYPYTASATTLTSILPQWAFVGGMEAMIERLEDKETRAKIRAEILANYAKSLRRFSDIVIADIPSAKNKVLIGKNIEEIAQMQSKEPVDAALDLIIEEKGDVNQITFGMCEEDVEMIMQHPLVMIGSDGSSLPLEGEDRPHPRNFGTFPRVLGYYSRERGLFPLETAVYKMTGFPASRLNLGNRGLLKPGFWADLVVFDPEKIIDTPTYLEPKRACAGIERVYVNGQLTVLEGKHTKAQAGQILRRGRM